MDDNDIRQVHGDLPSLDDDTTWSEFEKDVLEELRPMIIDSHLVMHIMPDTDQIDVKIAVELGLALLMDKPLIVVALAGRKVPDRVRAVADEVVEVDAMNSPEGEDKIHAAIRRVMA